MEIFFVEIKFADYQIRVIIAFYARDIAGNTDIESLIIIKTLPSAPGTISGYDIVLLTGLVSLVSAIIIKKKFIK